MAEVSWLSAIGGLIQLILRAFGFFDKRKAEEKERRKELEEAIKELEEKDDISNGDIVNTINRMQ